MILDRQYSRQLITRSLINIISDCDLPSTRRSTITLERSNPGITLRTDYINQASASSTEGRMFLRTLHKYFVVAYLSNSTSLLFRYDVQTDV